MNFNTFLFRFGLDSSNFVNKEIEPIPFNGGIIYEVNEERKHRICPYCNNDPLLIHEYKWVELKLDSTFNESEILRIKRIRYICPNCKKTHTFPLAGIERNKSISKYTKNEIIKEFYEMQSFSAIARRYNLSTQTVINIFDEYTRVASRLKLPEYLCIDEKHFEGDTNGKYVVVLTDFFTGEIVDIIENRQMPYLDRYFSSISFKERSNVKVVISDMYEGYLAVKDKYFPNALFVVDLFHVVKILTNTVNKIRIRTYNQILYEDTIERHFLKKQLEMLFN